MVQNVPAIAAAREDGTLMIGTVDSWVIYNLTDEKLHITDYTNASRTLLLSLRSLDWDSQLLEFFDIPRSALPRLVSNSEIYGCFKKGNILEGVTISSLIGDQQGALVGNKCLSLGEFVILFPEFSNNF